MKEFFKYRLLDKDGTFLYLNCVDSASVFYDSTSELKQSANITVALSDRETFNINDKLQIIHCLDNVETVVGTFLMSTPREIVHTHYRELNIDCFSTLWLLSVNKLVNRKIVPRGTQVTSEIRRLINELGYTIDIEDSTQSTSIDLEFDIGTSYLNLVNDLLGVINYSTLFVLNNGNFSAKKYVEPIERIVEIMYNDSEEDTNIISIYNNSIDFFDVPNIFVRYVNSPDVQLKAVFENNNIQNIFSTANRPPNVNVKEVRDVSDIQTLYDIAKRDCIKEGNKHATIEIQTSINPKHLYNNCVGLMFNGINDKYVERSWKFECITGGLMTHILEGVLIL